ncbi:MAG: hypothetical protein ACF8QF_08730 [Phycisphaerales bacterium]
MVVACACLAAPFVARAPGQVDRPEAAERLVGRFDFETDGSHLEPVPMHWVRRVDTPERPLPGFPAWNESGFDDAVAFQGDSSVVLPTRGGSSALRLSGGVLAVMPGADYVVSAHVRTRGLTHARARLTARLLDESLEPIPGGSVSSPGMQSPDRWREVRVALTGDRPEATWIQIDLELLQPEQYMQTPPAEHALRLEDFSGAAWFDEVEVRQLPRVTLATNSPVNFILAPQEPTLTARVLDLTGERLTGRMLVRDLDGRIVDAHDFDASSRGAGVSWSPKVSRFGWYDATLLIESAGERVAETHLAFVFAPGRAAPTDATRARFGLIASHASDAQLAPLRMLIERIGAGRVQLPLWSDAIGAEAFDRRLEAMEPVVGALLDRGLRVTLTLDGAMADGQGELVTALELAESAPLRLSDWLDPALVRFGQRIHRWQAGVAGDAAPSDQDELASKIAALEHVLSRLSPEPMVGLPWPGQRAPEGAVARDASLTLSVPSAAPASSVADYFALWRDAGASDAVALLERAPASVSTPRSRVTDLAKRAVFASIDGAPPIAIADPWRWNDATPSPAPEAAAWRTLTERLAGRTVVGALPAPAGATALILSGAPGASGSAGTPSGAIVAWRDWADPDDAVLRGYLGAETLTVYDLFGNERTARAGDAGAHAIALGPMPIFIEGVDERIASFRGQFRVEPPFIESIAARHDLELVIPNPWPAPISGRVRVVEPSHWDVAPRVQRFSAQPGEEVRLPVVATLGVGEEAGAHRLAVEIDLLADGEHPLFTIDAPVEVGLADVTMTATARITGVGEEADIVLTVLVTNTSDRRVTMTAFSTAPGFARQQAPISGLEPGASTVRQFVLRGGAAALKGRSVRVGLQDVDGPLRLNKTLEIR